MRDATPLDILGPMASRTEPVEGARRRTQKRFPWFLLGALAVSVYVFWILPTQLAERPVQVEFAKEGAATR